MKIELLKRPGKALFTRADIQPDTDIILYWRIEYRTKWILPDKITDTNDTML